MAHSVKYHREGWQEHKRERQALSGACALVLMCVFLDVRVCPRVWADTDEVSEFKRVSFVRVCPGRSRGVARGWLMRHGGGGSWVWCVYEAE